MQINIDKKTGILSGVIAVLIGVIIFLMGTQNSSSGLFGMNHSAMDGENNSTNSSLIGSDAMFFEMIFLIWPSLVPKTPNLLNWLRKLEMDKPPRLFK
jgi:hypothetical protein